jgi:hypothetical protein
MPKIQNSDHQYLPHLEVFNNNNTIDSFSTLIDFNVFSVQREIVYKICLAIFPHLMFVSFQWQSMF